MCQHVSPAAMYWSRTVWWYRSLIRELPPMATTALRFAMGLLVSSSTLRLWADRRRARGSALPTRFARACSHLDVSVGRQRMHEDGLLARHGHAPLVRDPVLVLIDDLGALGFVRGGEQRSPRLGVADVRTPHTIVEATSALEPDPGSGGVLLRLLQDLGHELELRRMGQPHVHPEPRKEEDQRLGNADRLLVRGSVGPADVDSLPSRVAEPLDDGHEVCQRLVRVVDVALHVEDRHPAGLGNLSHVPVARLPVDLPDGDPVVVASQDLPYLLGRVAVGDLGGAALDELRVPAEL